jgi:hypothetical protein
MLKLQIEFNVKFIDRRGGVACEVVVANTSTWYFPAGGWEFRKATKTKEIGMEVIVIEGVIDCLGINEITKRARGKGEQRGPRDNFGLTHRHTHTHMIFLR